MSDSSPWLRSYTKLRFFVRIRRFLQLKNSNKRSTPSDQFRKPTVTYIDGEGNRNVNKERESTEDELVIMQRSVKRLHFGSWQEKVAAAEEIRRLAKEDLKLRKSAAELGIVSPLVAMVGSEVGGRRRVAVQALIELANGSYKNKAMLVESEFLSKLPKDISALDESTRHEMAQLLLSISSLTDSQFPLNSSKLVPFLVGILESNSRIETKNLCIGTLHNLFTILDQVEILVTNEVVHILLSLSSLKETSEKALATLVNLVVTLKGKRAIENNPMMPNSLIEILTWEEKPKSQEFSTYILMILAHQSSTQKEKMVRLGIVPVLLEVALLGSPLAQKRALKLLQWFKDEHRAKFGPHSGPQMGRMGRVGIIGSLMNKRDVDEGRKMMKKLVRESLYKNMEKITRRANYGDDCSSKLKALVLSSSSKSLPY